MSQHSHFPTPAPQGPDTGIGAVFGFIALLVIGGIVFVIFILPAIQESNRKREEFDRKWNEQRAKIDREWNNWPGWPGQVDPKEEARRQAEREKLEAERTKFRASLDGLRQKGRALKEAGRYRELVAFIQKIDQDHGNEADRIGMRHDLAIVQGEAVKDGMEMAQREALALIQKDRYRDAQKVIEDMANDLRLPAQNASLMDRLDQVVHGYGFLAELADQANGQR